jgi:endonuclease YncB( thermonuclease family)
VDGDTIDALGKRIRLVGFDAPELGEHAHCGLERMLAARATSRLRQMIQLNSDILADRRLLMSARHCWDDGLRSCGYITIDGRNVGDVLIAENWGVDK